MQDVQGLHTARDELLARIASLERTLDDVTGSIARQSAAAAAPTMATAISAPAAPDQASAEPLPHAPAPAAAPAAVPPASLPADGTAVQAAALQAASEGGDAALSATGVVAGTPVVEGSAEAEVMTAETKPVFGLDLGSATSFDGLRGLWKSTLAVHPTVVEGLHPLVVARENARTRKVELRLIAGPLPDAEAANDLCSVLAAARRHCQLVPFEGQQLVLASPPARPAAAQRSVIPTPARPPR
jgi:hypothetical protein